jgi:cell division protein FtsW (lipid II flippase)
MTLLNRLREVDVDRRNNRSDQVLFGTMLALSGFGLLMIYSATRSAGSVSMERQMIFVAAGLTIYLIASHRDFRGYRPACPWIWS